MAPANNQSKILDDYHSQIQHLQKEMESIKSDFEETEKAFRH